MCNDWPQATDILHRRRNSTSLCPLASEATSSRHLSNPFYRHFVAMRCSGKSQLRSHVVDVFRCFSRILLCGLSVLFLASVLQCSNPSFGASWIRWNMCEGGLKNEGSISPARLATIGFLKIVVTRSCPFVSRKSSPSCPPLCLIIK